MPDLRWDPMAGRYRAPNGRFVADSAVRAAVDDLIATAAGRVAALTDRLRAGALRLPDWQQQMAHELKGLHVVAATVAHGGKAQMAPADYGRVSAVLRREYGFLARFARDVAQGRQPLDGRADQRARLYAGAARATYEETRRQDARTHGLQLEQRVLSAAEHCEPCRALADGTWHPLGSLPRRGEGTPCRTNCRCRFIFRRGEAA